MSLEELKKYPSGKIWELEDNVVLPGREEKAGRFDLMPEDVAEEVALFRKLTLHAGDIRSHGKRFSHLLTSRRVSIR